MEKFKLYGIVLLAAWTAEASKIVPGACYQDQLAGLRVLYYLTDGPHWTQTWDVDGDPCLDSWYGVTCDGDGNILEIDLYRNHLRGRIPESFTRFPELRRLDVTANELTGPVPSSLKRLGNLRVFRIAQNEFTGVLDADFFLGMPLLREVDISDNSFSGQLSERIYASLRPLGGKFDFIGSQEGT